jgi:hypothetical protein
MHTRRLLVLGVSALVLLTTSFVRAQQTSTPARPIVELEKPRFASNEQIFFWIGVTAPDNYRIPESLRTSGRLTITRPDGTTRVDVVGWPIDGPGDRGWRGGHGLRGETPQIGRYTLVMEFTWNLVDRVPTVTLPAGGTYRLPLPLAPTLSAYIGRMPSGEYEIVFGTSVQILVGARDGAHADLAPLRLAVSSTSRAVR